MAAMMRNSGATEDMLKVFLKTTVDTIVEDGDDVSEDDIIKYLLEEGGEDEF
jgi:hypothetical protein